MALRRLRVGDASRSDRSLVPGVSAQPEVRVGACSRPAPSAWVRSGAVPGAARHALRLVVSRLGAEARGYGARGGGGWPVLIMPRTASARSVGLAALGADLVEGPSAG